MNCPNCHKSGLVLIRLQSKFVCNNCGKHFKAVEKGGFYRIKLG